MIQNRLCCIINAHDGNDLSALLNNVGRPENSSISEEETWRTKDVKWLNAVHTGAAKAKPDLCVHGGWAEEPTTRWGTRLKIVISARRMKSPHQEKLAT